MESKSRGTLVLLTVAFALLASVAHAAGAHALPPISEDVEVGKEALQRSLKLMASERAADPEMVARVQGILHRVAAVSDLPALPYEIHVVPSSIANAGCYPGGKIIMFEGIWDKKKGFVRKDKEDELASIVAHEVAHAAKRHWARREKGGERPRHAEYEIEADYRGMIYMARAGYNPKTMIRVFSRQAIREARGHQHSHRPISRYTREWQQTFASHPTGHQRAQALRQNLREAMEIYRATK
ncbi:MAG: M48 family metalloprotease [Deltaproteobacteria bacterium]|nr:M48 family metalloprotease [Deltaproteobacteria bacterium]